MVLLEIDSPIPPMPTGPSRSFCQTGTPIGQVSSGGYGHSVGKSLALAYLKAGRVAPGETVHVAILGRAHTARRLAAPPFDPEGHRLREIAPVNEPAE